MAQAAYCDSYTQYGTASPGRWKQTSETQRQFFRSQMRAVVAALVAAGLLAACTPPAPPIAVNSYCEVKGTERIDLTDKGIRGLTPENKRAVLTGDDNYHKICLLGDRSQSLGPR